MFINNNQKFPRTTGTEIPPLGDSGLAVCARFTVVKDARTWFWTCFGWGKLSRRRARSSCLRKKKYLKSTSIFYVTRPHTWSTFSRAASSSANLWNSNKNLFSVEDQLAKLMWPWTARGLLLPSHLWHALDWASLANHPPRAHESERIN